MVIKGILYIFLLSTFLGCCYNGKVSEYGLPRKEIRRLKPSITYVKIDTLSLYKAVISFHFNNLSNEYTYFEKNDNNSYSYTSYLKFYPEGKVGLFIIPKADTLQLERYLFNPSRAKMGYYWIEGASIRTRISTIGDCSLYISNKKGTIKGDSINLQDNTHHGNIYIKKQVSSELLKNWKPDW
jgi:hypothetical protein